MSGRRVTPGMQARRALLVDVLLAVAVAVLALLLTAGLGVAAIVALPVMLVGLLWIGTERGVRRVRRRRRPAR